MEVLENFVMPATQRGGLTGSKFVSKEQLAAIHALNLKAAVILPFMKFAKTNEKGEAVEAEDKQKQRLQTANVLKNPLYTKGLQQYAVGITAEGIAVQRVADKVIAAEVVVPEKA